MMYFCKFKASSTFKSTLKNKTFQFKVENFYWDLRFRNLSSLMLFCKINPLKVEVEVIKLGPAKSVKCLGKINQRSKFNISYT